MKRGIDSYWEGGILFLQRGDKICQFTLIYAKSAVISLICL